MTIVQKTAAEHLEEALNNLLDQFQDKADVVALLQSYIKQIPDLENALFQLLEDRLPIATAEGEQLDGIGAIVGEGRQGRSDVDYRIGLVTRIILNNCSGTRDELISILDGVEGPGVTIVVNEYDPAAFEIELVDPVAPGYDPTRTGNFIKSAKPAGVRSVYKYNLASPFTFDSGPGWDAGTFGGAI